MLHALFGGASIWDHIARSNAREAHTRYVEHWGEWAWRNLRSLYQKANEPVPISEIVPGRSASVVVKTSWWSTWYFAFCTGDFNRAHFEAVAPYKGPIVHGMHLASYISKLLGMDLPGPGTIFSRMNKMVWMSPVFIGETIIAKIVVKEVQPRRTPDEMNRITFIATITKEDGTPVFEAEPIAYIQ